MPLGSGREAGPAGATAPLPGHSPGVPVCQPGSNSIGFLAWQDKPGLNDWPVKISGVNHSGVERSCGFHGLIHRQGAGVPPGLPVRATKAKAAELARQPVSPVRRKQRRWPTGGKQIVVISTRGAPLSASCWISSRSLAVTQVVVDAHTRRRAAFAGIAKTGNKAHWPPAVARAVPTMNPCDSMPTIRSGGWSRSTDLGEHGAITHPAAACASAASESRRGMPGLGNRESPAPIPQHRRLDWYELVWQGLAIASGRVTNRLGRWHHRSLAMLLWARLPWLNLP